MHSWALSQPFLMALGVGEDPLKPRILKGGEAWTKGWKPPFWPLWALCLPGGWTRGGGGGVIGCRAYVFLSRDCV